MEPLIIKDRLSERPFQEKVYGGGLLHLLYPKSPFLKVLSWPLLQLIVKLPFFSAFFGYLQRRPSSKKRIEPFIRDFGLNMEEFEKKASEFISFDDFFTRKLKPQVRRLEGDLIIPADGRYRFIPNLSEEGFFYVKGQKFNLEELVQDSSLAQRFEGGSLVIARLAPPDYHRFHFPCAAHATKPRLIKGPLYSVNPIALKQKLSIVTQNKRVLTELKSETFGHILYVDVGATCVGSIHQTFYQKSAALQSSVQVEKGQEKGFFGFGASTVLLVFERGKIIFEKDLTSKENNQDPLEILCRFGQKLGQSL